MSERLAEAIEALEQRVQVVADTLEEIRMEFSWIVRNGIPIPSDWKQVETIPETVTCAGGCDAMADSLAEAVQAGWTRIGYDPEGMSWNYVGCCPDCQQEQPFQKQVPESERASFVEHFKKVSEEKKPQGELF